MRANWSLIKAINGDIYSTFTPDWAKLTFERIGKNAASVLPEAVLEARIRFSDVDKTLAIAAA
jgi:hypothetical protein